MSILANLERGLTGAEVEQLYSVNWEVSIQQILQTVWYWLSNVFIYVFIQFDNMGLVELGSTGEQPVNFRL